jgi:hypothetical protein
MHEREIMNVSLLLRVKEAILEDPKHFDMGDFFTPANGCETAGCIAGWAIALGHDTDLGDAAEIADNYPLGVQRMAVDTLHISNTQGRILFYVAHWPADLRIAWHDAKSSASEARVAARRIDLFIESGGDV